MMTKSKERRRNEGVVNKREENPRRRCWPVHIYTVQDEGFQLAVMGWLTDSRSRVSRVWLESTSEIGNNGYA
jgi:hypothetical protein